MAIATVDVKALQVARSAERITRELRPAKQHDKVVEAVTNAGFPLDIAIRAAWEALSE